MDPISNQALRAALDHETTSIVRQLQADNERLRNELATAKANLANRYLRSVLNAIDKHRDMGSGSLDVIDERLVPAWSAALVFWRHDATRDVVDFVLANFFYIWHSARHRRAPRGR